ncbi:hypothetical protein J6590_097444 [Homalodisca vitripennis]|nr:hypothetical protein J6590_085404 [Homalodisca vitripennis]KAG8265566.1 hypothetical protein J6590_092127 [Homalodisca vitripennis]KAG8304284.1 hypothetical protein J6590_097444 [Homalodisca vitripennis]
MHPVQKLKNCTVLELVKDTIPLVRLESIKPHVPVALASHKNAPLLQLACIDDWFFGSFVLTSVDEDVSPQRGRNI